MIRKFRVLKDVYVNISDYDYKPIMKYGDIIEVTILDDSIYTFNGLRFNESWFKHFLKCGYIKEILEDKALISSDTKEGNMLDYNKKYNIFDAVHLMKNHDIKMIDSKFGFTWEYYSSYHTLWTDSFEENCDMFIEDFFDENFGYIDSLDLTFMLVKPKEEKKFTSINSHKELCRAIVDKKEFYTCGVKCNFDMFNNGTIDTLYNMFDNGVKLEYIED